MFQSFIIFWREGFEAFLIVAITLTYLRRTGRSWLGSAVYSGVAASLVASTALGYVLLKGVNHALWEGILGLVAVVMVGSLVIHMWRTAPQLKGTMEKRLGEVSSSGSRRTAWLGIFFFTLFMITREGMETALMLMQVRDSRFLTGLVLGLGAAGVMAWAWIRFGRRIDLGRFFQVTGIFLLLFMVQIAIYSFHELSEAGLVPNSEAFHEATEPFSPYGTYGKWFPSLIVLICGVWLIGAWMVDHGRRTRAAVIGASLLAALVAAERGVAEPTPEATATAQRDRAEARDDSLAAELARRLHIVAAEVERLRLGETAAPRSTTVPRGLGRSAGKVYGIASGVSIGGYGEMLYQGFADEREDGAPAGRTNLLDFLRGVLYVGYKFNDRWLVNSEIEFEHGSTGEGGEVSLEFVTVEALWRPEVNLRAGLVLLPMGFLNELHEPTIFLGARRPTVEQALIPTTWRENGAGIYGDAGPFTYRTYVVAGLDALGFSAAGIRGGRQKGAQSKAEDLAWTGRLDVVTIPGVLAGVAAYVGDSGQGLQAPDGSEVHARTTLIDGHGEWTWRGVELRVLGARATIDDVARLNAAHPDSLTGNQSIGETQTGAYVQLGYDILSPWHEGEQALIPYVRWETLNTQDEVPAGFSANPANDAEVLTVGVAYRPIDAVIFKADFQNQGNAADTGTDQVNVALGYIF